MSAQHPFLNTIREINSSYFDSLYDDARKLIESATTEIERVSASFPEINFDGIIPDFLDPSAVELGELPPAPTKPALDAVPVGAFPSAPILTMDTVATDAILINLVSAIKSAIEYRLTHATGLNADVEAALFARGIDRETKLQQSGYDNYLANNSSLGWSSAPGQDRAAFFSF